MEGDTAWQAISAAVEENRLGFPDTALIKGMWLVDTHCRRGASQFDEDNDRSAVVLGQVAGREECVEADSNRAITLFYRDAVCRAGRNEYEEFSPHKPSTFQPKCLVLLIEAESRAKLRDELVASGRLMTDPLLVQVNYTTARSPNPDLDVTSSSCALGREMLALYELDKIGQEERDALERVRAELARTKMDLFHFERVYKGMSLLQPPQAPPPPPPPDYENAPPGAPRAITYVQQMEVYRQSISRLTSQEKAMAAEIAVCVPSTENACGRTSLEAPNPWLANDNEPCFGNDTYEALEGAYCGYWGSPVCYCTQTYTRPLTPDLAVPCPPLAGQRRRCRTRRTNRDAHS